MSLLKAMSHDSTFVSNHSHGVTKVKRYIHTADIFTALFKHVEQHVEWYDVSKIGLASRKDKAGAKYPRNI